MIVFPTTAQEAAAATGEFRAGGTDLFERRFDRPTPTDVIDLRDVKGLDELQKHADGQLRIGARVTVATLATGAGDDFVGLAEAAASVATPQIRAVATVGGNLLQRTRCRYLRAPEVDCVKGGGQGCPATSGDHLDLACFGRAQCRSVHPSTLAMALLAYDAVAEVHGAEARTLPTLLGDGSDSKRDHQLEEGALLTGLLVPPPWPGERSAYYRATSRARAEWPLVEAVARIAVEDGRITSASVAIGGVAPRPLRRSQVERALVGRPISTATLRAAAAQAKAGARPLPDNAYKVDLVEATVLTVLERATQRETSR